MRRRAAAGLALAAVLASTLVGCSLFRRPPPPGPSAARYTVGEGYPMGGVWYYPAEHSEYREAGLAAVLPDHAGFTADGERFDSTALAAAHHTLQLPAVARVTNLANGRSLLVRLNDRGPANPGRLVGLTTHAAALLGVQDGTQVEVELDGALTRALTEQVGGGPKLVLAVAPTQGVAAENLPPPSGVGQVAPRRGAASPRLSVVPDAPAPTVPDRLPDQVEQRPSLPGLVLLQASEFGRADYARRLAAQLAGIGARVERLEAGRSERYRVVAGPFDNVAAADAALDQALRAGVIDSRLVVREE